MVAAIVMVVVILVVIYKIDRYCHLYLLYILSYCCGNNVVVFVVLLLSHLVPDVNISPCMDQGFDTVTETVP